MELSEETYVCVDKHGNITTIKELLKPVKYGENRGVDITVLESTGEYVGEDNFPIKDFEIVGEL